MRAESGPPADYDPTQFGEGNIYYGPALMWHELRKRIGDDAFWKVVRDWPARDPETNAARDEYLDWLVDQTHVDRVLLRGLAAQPDHPRALLTPTRRLVTVTRSAAALTVYS